MIRDVLKLAPLLFLIGLVAVVALVRGGGHVGETAAPFTLSIAVGEGEGDRVALDALRGQVVVLDFWASWCGPCRRSTPILNRLHDTYGPRGVHLYGVSAESERAMREGYALFRANYPSLGDPRGVIMTQYDVQGLPTLVVIGRDGTILFQESGVPNEGRLSQVLDEALAAAP